MSEAVGARFHDSRYGFGVACLLTATLFTSLAGILLRLMEEADAWQVLFYRSLSFVVVLLGWLVYRHGRGTPRAFRAVAWPGAVVAVTLAISFATFILALLETTVANVVFINGGTPFFAALFAWLALREPVRPVVWLAMAAAFCGIAIMFAGGVARGTLTGNLLALICSLSFAVTLVAMRRGKAVDMLPAVCLAGVLVVVIAAPLVESFRISAHDLALAVILGVVQLALQYILVTTGSRHVPTAEIALIGRTVIVLAPLWVWIGVGEVPTTATLIGGAIVLLAVVGQAFWSLRPNARLASP
jgi:drug/metabolite transporter (DMT)-like permease